MTSENGYSPSWVISRAAPGTDQATMTGRRVIQEKIRHTTPEPTEIAHTHDAVSWGDRSAATAASRVTRRGPAYEMATAMNRP